MSVIGFFFLFIFSDPPGAAPPLSEGGFKEELEFNFDEDMELSIPPTGRQNRFSAAAAAVCGDSDTDLDELSDGEISKLLIVTQAPNRPRKHEGYDRTGDFTSRAKMTQELAQVINDGLVYYEEGRMLNDSEDETDDDGWVGGLGTFFVKKQTNKQNKQTNTP